MSALNADLQRILDVATEAKVNFGSSNPQLFFKSILNTLPALEESSDSSSRDSSTSDLLMNADYSTPIRANKSVSVNQTGSPTLSLPASFDGEYVTQSGEVRTRFVPAILHGVKGTNVEYQGECLKCKDTKFICQRDMHDLEIKLKRASAEKLEEHEKEFLRFKKLHASTEENHRLEVASLEDRIQRLSSMLDTESSLRRHHEEKALKFEKADEELRSLKLQIEEMRIVMDQQKSVVASLTSSEFNARKAAEDAGRVRDLLSLDKTFLQQEIKNLEVRVEDRMRAAEEANSKALALEVKVAQLTEHLLTLQLNARTGFDERMEKEITRLREDSSREMEAMKATSREITDRENRVLREAKLSLENECNQLKRRNDTLLLDVSGLQRELAATTSQKNNEISEVRAELKMKSFELTSLGVNYEERMGQLRQTELQLESLQQEIVMHKQALLKLESDSHHRITALTDDLDKATLRLRAYEVLEEEIDSAILRTANGCFVVDPSTGEVILEGNDVVDRQTAKLLQSVKGIPCNPERRVKQAVYLAQRLLETERQRDQLAVKLEEALKSLQEGEKTIHTLQENLSHTTQPSAYLITKLRDEEALKVKATDMCKRLEAELRQRKQSEQQALYESAQLRERLTSLLEQRGELETVKVMLRQMCELNRTPHLMHYGVPTEDTDGENDEDPAAVSTPVKKLAVESKGTEMSPPQQQSGLGTAFTMFGLSPEMIESMTSPPHSSRK